MASPDAGGTQRRPADRAGHSELHGIVWRAAVSGQVASLLDDRREAAAREVLAALAAGDGLVALTGPERVGKTAVLDAVAARLEGAGVRVLRVEGAAAADGRLSLRALLAQVAGRDIGGMEEGAVEELLDLLDGTGSGAGVVVAVDDAQNLQPDAAEFFRLLAMLARGQKRRSRVVFAGRPEFWDIFPDDLNGRSRLVGTRIAMPADEPVVTPAPPVAAPPVAAPPVAVQPVAPQVRPPRRWAIAVAGLGLGGLIAAALLLPRPVEVVPAAIVAVPVEAPTPGAPVWAVIAEAPVETPPSGGTARRPFAEMREETPVPGWPAPWQTRLAEQRSDVGPVGGVAAVRVEEPVEEPVVEVTVVEAPVVGAPVVEMPVVEVPVEGRPVERQRAGLLVAGVLGEAAAVEPFEISAAGDPVLAAALMRRGAALLEVGDISAARLAFGRAVGAGEAAAATALGRTFDPRFLAEIGGRGIEGDAAEAERWYRRGADMGDEMAAAVLRGLASR